MGNTQLEISHDMHAKGRIEFWRTALQQELQDVMKSVAAAHAHIQEAKTKTKVDYYKRKQKKLQTHAIQLLNALERLPAPRMDDSSNEK